MAMRVTMVAMVMSVVVVRVSVGVLHELDPARARMVARAN